MFDFFFILTLCSFVLLSVLSVLSLYSDKERYFKATIISFYISVLLFFITGIIKFNPTSAEALVSATHTIWGYFFLIISFILLILLYLNFTRWKHQLKSIMALASPFITIILIFSIPYIDSQRRFETDLQHSLLPVHIFIATIGEILFFFSFVGSVLYLVMEWQLKKKSSMKFIYRLPNLETIENFNRWAISRSVMLLTIGIILGIILVWVKFSALFLASPKEIVIYASWLVILIIAYLRFKTNVTSHKVSQINTALFIIVMCLYIITNIFITTGFHSYK